MLTYDTEIPNFLLDNGFIHLQGDVFDKEKIKEMGLGHTPIHSWTEEKIKNNKGASFNRYQKNNFWIEIKEHWNNLYDHDSAYKLSILDVTKAFYCNGGYIGWMGINQLLNFKKKPSIEFLKLALEHLEII